MKTRLFFSTLLTFSILLAACSAAAPTPQANQPTQANQDTPATPLAVDETTIKLGQTAELGPFLVDSLGKTLYLFTSDTPNTSSCYDACATTWPPVLANGNIKADQGVDEAKLGLTKRTDGTLQVTYNGWPLYYFAKDAKAGDTTGQGVKSVWFVVSANGDKVEVQALAPGATKMALASSGETITIADFVFDRSPLTVKVGTTVTWTNQDSASHNVVADNGDFKSNTLKKGDTFSFTFTKAGTYAYYCSFHGGPNGEGMSGQIIVTP